MKLINTIAMTITLNAKVTMGHLKMELSIFSQRYRILNPHFLILNNQTQHFLFYLYCHIFHQLYSGEHFQLYSAKPNYKRLSCCTLTKT
jgi:hypothetical protein